MIFPFFATISYINNFFWVRSNTLLLRPYGEKIQKIERIQNRSQDLKTEFNNVVLNKVSIKASNKVNVTKRLDYRIKFIA